MAAVGSPSNVSRSDRSTAVAISRRTVELVPSRVDRRDALAGMRQQRADLFERIARPVEDRRGGAPEVMRRPPFHPQSDNDPVRRFMQIVAAQIEHRHGRIGLEMRPQQFEREA